MSLREWRMVPGQPGVMYPAHAFSPMVRYGRIGATEPARAWPWLLGAAAVLAVLLVFGADEDGGREGPGWYVLLYEYEPDEEPLSVQRTKGFAGPYRTKA